MTFLYHLIFNNHWLQILHQNQLIQGLHTFDFRGNYWVLEGQCLNIYVQGIRFALLLVLVLQCRGINQLSRLHFRHHFVQVLVGHPELVSEHSNQPILASRTKVQDHKPSAFLIDH